MWYLNPIEGQHGWVRGTGEVKRINGYWKITNISLSVTDTLAKNTEITKPENLHITLYYGTRQQQYNSMGVYEISPYRLSMYGKEVKPNETLDFLYNPSYPIILPSANPAHVAYPAFLPKFPIFKGHITVESTRTKRNGQRDSLKLNDARKSRFDNNSHNWEGSKKPSILCYGSTGNMGALKGHRQIYKMDQVKRERSENFKEAYLDPKDIATLNINSDAHKESMKKFHSLLHSNADDTEVWVRAMEGTDKKDRNGLYTMSADKQLKLRQFGLCYTTKIRITRYSDDQYFVCRTKDSDNSSVYPATQEGKQAFKNWKKVMLEWNAWHRAYERVEERLRESEESAQKVEQRLGKAENDLLKKSRQIGLNRKILNKYRKTNTEQWKENKELRGGLEKARNVSSKRLDLLTKAKEDDEAIRGLFGCESLPNDDTPTLACVQWRLQWILREFDTSLKKVETQLEERSRKLGRSENNLRGAQESNEKLQAELAVSEKKFIEAQESKKKLEDDLAVSEEMLATAQGGIEVQTEALSSLENDKNELEKERDECITKLAKEQRDSENESEESTTEYATDYSDDCDSDDSDVERRRQDIENLTTANNQLRGENGKLRREKRSEGYFKKEWRNKWYETGLQYHKALDCTTDEEGVITPDSTKKCVKKAEELNQKIKEFKEIDEIQSLPRFVEYHASFFGAQGLDNACLKRQSWRDDCLTRLNELIENVQNGSSEKREDVLAVPYSKEFLRGFGELYNKNIDEVLEFLKKIKNGKEQLEDLGIVLTPPTPKMQRILEDAELIKANNSSRTLSITENAADTPEISNNERRLSVDEKRLSEESSKDDSDSYDPYDMVGQIKQGIKQGYKYLEKGVRRWKVTEIAVLGLAATAGGNAICSDQGPLSDAISTTASLLVKESFLNQTPVNQAELFVKAISEKVGPDNYSVSETFEIAKNATSGVCTAPDSSRIPSAIPTNRLTEANLRTPTSSPIAPPKPETVPTPTPETTRADIDDLYIDDLITNITESESTEEEKVSKLKALEGRSGLNRLQKSQIELALSSQERKADRRKRFADDDEHLKEFRAQNREEIAYKRGAELEQALQQGKLVNEINSEQNLDFIWLTKFIDRFEGGYYSGTYGTYGLKGKEDVIKALNTHFERYRKKPPSATGFEGTDSNIVGFNENWEPIREPAGAEDEAISQNTKVQEEVKDKAELNDFVKRYTDSEGKIINAVRVKYSEFDEPLHLLTVMLDEDYSDDPPKRLATTAQLLKKGANPKLMNPRNVFRAIRRYSIKYLYETETTVEENRSTLDEILTELIGRGLEVSKLVGGAIGTHQQTRYGIPLEYDAYYYVPIYDTKGIVGTSTGELLKNAFDNDKSKGAELVRNMVALDKRIAEDAYYEKLFREFLEKDITLELRYAKENPNVVQPPRDIHGKYDTEVRELIENPRVGVDIQKELFERMEVLSTDKNNLDQQFKDKFNSDIWGDYENKKPQWFHIADYHSLVDKINELGEFSTSETQREVMKAITDEYKELLVWHREAINELHERKSLDVEYDDAVSENPPKDNSTITNVLAKAVSPPSTSGKTWFETLGWNKNKGLLETAKETGQRAIDWADSLVGPLDPFRNENWERWNAQKEARAAEQEEFAKRRAIYERNKLLDDALEAEAYSKGREFDKLSTLVRRSENRERDLKYLKGKLLSRRLFGNKRTTTDMNVLQETLADFGVSEYNEAEAQTEAQGIQNKRYVKDLKYGKRNHIVKYTGWLDEKGRPHDENGKYEYSNGHTHEGVFEHGAQHGQAVTTFGKDVKLYGFQYRKGDRLKGEWKNYQRQGKFTLTRLDGTMFAQVIENQELKSTTPIPSSTEAPKSKEKLSKTQEKKANKAAKDKRKAKRKAKLEAQQKLKKQAQQQAQQKPKKQAQPEAQPEAEPGLFGNLLKNLTRTSNISTSINSQFHPPTPIIIDYIII
tara:strand:+ start:4344 stop:10190 length:5847 start_codon:yes stop_codon:yes gene_type:complete